MKGLNPINPELLEKWIKELNSDSIYNLANAAQMLTESENSLSVEPLVNRANATTDWLVQDIVVRALTEMACKIPEADAALNEIVLIEPPKTNHVLEIKQTLRSPYVYFDFERGKLIFWGKGTDSVVAHEILKSLFSDFELFDKIYPNKPLIASFCMKRIIDEYDRGFRDFFKKIQQHPSTIVYWHYELLGDRMTLMGESYSESFPDLKFILLEVPQSGPYFDY
jgi:hypothetical protein